MDTKYIIEEQTLTNIANSIRSQENSVEPVPVEEFAERVNNLELTAEEYATIIELTSERGFAPKYSFDEQELNKTQLLLNKLIQIEEVI